MHILIIRFSAMGDVAMTVPVLKNLLNKYADLTITIVSNKNFAAFFHGIDRCHFIGASLKGEHKGIPGLHALYRQIKKDVSRIDFVADLHNVLRSIVLTTFFRMAGNRVAVIEKGRIDKQALTRKENKDFKQLKTSHQRYADVFARLGFPVELSVDGSFLPKGELPRSLQGELLPQKKLVGIAPFAQHQGKMYPLQRMEKIVEMLHQSGLVQILFFGGGNEETHILNQWQQKFPGAVSCAGKFPLSEELHIISNLHLMVSMDSSNMHLASLYNVPVVSIWGATHPYAGFYGWAQDDSNIVQQSLYCRPCSVFGNKPCYRGDWACLDIPELQIFQKILLAIQH